MNDKREFGDMTMRDVWGESGSMRRITVVATLIVTVSGASIVIAHAWEWSEPYRFATRAYTREVVAGIEAKIIAQIKSGDTKASDRLTAIERSLLEDKFSKALEERKTIRTRIGSFQADLAKSDISETGKRIISEQLERLQDDKLDNDRRIDELRVQLAK